MEETGVTVDVLRQRFLEAVLRGGGGEGGREGQSRQGERETEKDRQTDREKETDRDRLGPRR
jgi:hypothetical protein